MKKSPFSFRSFLEDNFPMLPLALLSCMLFGIASYGVLLFQKLSVHDDIHYFFSVGATYSSGRWFLGLLGELVSRVFGSGHFSTSEWNGLLTLLFLGLTQGVLVSLLELKRKRSVVLACGILTVFPSICSLFGYAFTAPYYTFGYLLAALGVWLTTKKRWGYLGGIVLIACSTGIYQANFAFSLCLLLLVFLHRVAGAEHWTWADLARTLLCNALVCALALGLYLAANTLAVKLSGTVLDSYMGISDMTNRGLSVYLRRVRQALFLFFRPGAASRRAHAFPFQTLPLYYVTLVLDFLYALLLLYRARKSSPARLLTLILGMAAFPLAVNFIYVLSDFQDSHVLMVYCQAMVFVALCDLAEHVPVSVPLRRLAAAVLVFTALCYVRYDNIYATQFEIYQQRSISYLNQLSTQIKQFPGYTAQTKVAFVSKNAQMDATFPDIPELEVVSALPFSYHVSAISDGFRDYLNIWCGFVPEYADPADYQDLPQVMAMPSYPDSGSMAMIGDTLVVKFWGG